MILTSDIEGARLDKYIAESSDYSRAFIQMLINDNKISVNGRLVKANYKMKKNDEIHIVIPKIQVLDVKPQNIKIDVIYEDDSLLVVNKEKGMVVHPAAGNRENTLVNALLSYCENRLSSINSVARPGIVHRIDKDTSGLLVVAKTDTAHLSLAAQLKAHSMERTYHCIVNGVISQEKGIIDAPVGRKTGDRKKMAVTASNSKNAITRFHVLERFDGYTYLNCKLETGRTHQIRVHLSHVGYPLLGDGVYGSGKNDFQISGQLLHAKTLGFVHPSTGEKMEFDAPLPAHFEQVLTALRN